MFQLTSNALNFLVTSNHFLGSCFKVNQMNVEKRNQVGEREFPSPEQESVDFKTMQ